MLKLFSKFGGEYVRARIMSSQSVFSSMKPKARGGEGGNIPWQLEPKPQSLRATLLARGRRPVLSWGAARPNWAAARACAGPTT